MVENRMTVDSEWSSMEEKPDIPKGQFDRWGGFVHEDFLLEVALEEVSKTPTTRDSFLEKILDYIEENEEAKDKFLRWFYPEYKKENKNDKQRVSRT